MQHVVSRYADLSSACVICLTQCSFSQLRCGHLRRSSSWPLNSAFRFQPISTQVDELANQREPFREACRVSAGSRVHMTIFIGLSLIGPLLSAIGQQGDSGVLYHRSLPCGPGRQCRAPQELAVVETLDVRALRGARCAPAHYFGVAPTCVGGAHSSDLRAGQEIITRISWIPDPLGVIS